MGAVVFMKLLKNKRRKQAKKTSEESRRRKTSDTITKIYEYFAQYDEAKTKDIAEYIAPNNEKIS